jgi:type VI secretion system secreted protein VgrG
MKIVIESGLELTLKSSGGFIKIDPAGITIMGTMVLINSGGAPGVIPKPPDEADDAKPGAVDTRP